MLLLWGENDEVTPVSYGYRLANELANADIARYPRCGHIPMVEARSRSTRDLVEFLAKDEDHGHDSGTGRIVAEAITAAVTVAVAGALQVAVARAGGGGDGGGEEAERASASSTATVEPTWPAPRLARRHDRRERPADRRGSSRRSAPS